MADDSQLIAFDFLLTASKISLEDAMLRRHADVSNRRKQLVELLDKWAESHAELLLLEWFLTHGNNLMAAVTQSPRLTELAPLCLPEKPGPISSSELRERLISLLDSA
jgi:hypothetical protein